MGAGRKNVVAGFLVLTLAMLVGSYLEATMEHGPAEEGTAAAEKPSEHSEHADMARGLVTAIHSHANTFAVICILIGLVLSRTGLGDGAKSAASWLGVAAVVLFPLALLLILVTGVVHLGMLAMLGGLCLIAATAITFIGLLEAPAEA